MANELGLKGWVKNLPDGNVEITAEGSEDTINDFIRFVKRGPSLCRVLKADISKNEIDDYKYPGFSIAY